MGRAMVFHGVPVASHTCTVYHCWATNSPKLVSGQLPQVGHENSKQQETCLHFAETYTTLKCAMATGPGGQQKLVAAMLPGTKNKKDNMRKGSVIIGLSVIFCTLIGLFWYNAWVYSLPTPVPAQYHAVGIGDKIAITPAKAPEGARPLFIHFFNPDCPCSRFNIAHFKSLVKDYHDKVNFEVVAITAKQYTEQEIQDKFQLNIPVSFDSSIAAACGIYSTPQAAIIDTGSRLYYRGNYNRSRYCTDKKSNYAQMALEGLLNKRNDIAFDKYALKAYGCQLPTCIKNEENDN